MFQQKKLWILQYNVHKFREKMMIALLHEKKIKNYDILILQELWWFDENFRAYCSATVEFLNFFLIFTWFNTHYESMQDSIYCSEHYASVIFFLHQKSLLSALYTITVFNARTLWIYFFSIFSLFHLIL